MVVVVAGGVEHRAGRPSWQPLSNWHAAPRAARAPRRPSVVNIANIQTARTYYSMDVMKIPAGQVRGCGGARCLRVLSERAGQGHKSRQRPPCPALAALPPSSSPNARLLRCAALLSRGWPQGSGFVWDDKGHIVTNYHVIRGASEVQASVQAEPGAPVCPPQGPGAGPQAAGAAAVCVCGCPPARGLTACLPARRLPCRCR